MDKVRGGPVGAKRRPGRGAGRGCPPPCDRRRRESRSDSRRLPVERAPRRETRRGIRILRSKGGGRGAFSTGCQPVDKVRGRPVGAKRRPGRGAGRGCPPPRDRRRRESRSDSRRLPVERAPRRETRRGLRILRSKGGGRGAFSTGCQPVDKVRGGPVGAKRRPGRGAGRGCPPPRDRRRRESRSDSRRLPVERAPRRETRRGLRILRSKGGGRGAFSTGCQPVDKVRGRPVGAKRRPGRGAGRGCPPPRDRRRRESRSDSRRLPVERAPRRETRRGLRILRSKGGGRGAFSTGS